MADEGRKSMTDKANSTEPEGGVGRQPVPRIELLGLSPLLNSIDMEAMDKLVRQTIAMAFGIPERLLRKRACQMK